MSLTVITFLYEQPRRWRQLKYGHYGARHVNALRRACEDRLGVPHRFLTLTDSPEGVEGDTMRVWPAIRVNGEDACYRRLGAFDEEFQRSLGTEFALLLDLDVVLLRDCREVLEAAMERDFTIMRGSSYADGTQASLYNGGMWLCRAGARHRFWAEFSPEKCARAKEALIMPNGKRVMGSDQAWISCVSPDEATFGPEDGVAQYHMYRRKSTVKSRRVLKQARMVFFAGPRKPWGPSVASAHPRLAAEWRRYDG